MRRSLDAQGIETACFTSNDTSLSHTNWIWSFFSRNSSSCGLLHDVYWQLGLYCLWRPHCSKRRWCSTCDLANRADLDATDSLDHREIVMISICIWVFLDPFPNAMASLPGFRHYKAYIHLFLSYHRPERKPP